MLVKVVPKCVVIKTGGDSSRKMWNTIFIHEALYLKNMGLKVCGARVQFFVRMLIKNMEHNFRLRGFVPEKRGFENLRAQVRFFA